MNVLTRFNRFVRKAFTGAEEAFPGGRFTLLNLWPGSRTVESVSMREGLAHHLAYRCILKICEAAADCMPVVERRTRAGWKVENHPLTSQLYKPNPEQTWPEFIASLMIDKHVFGRYYVQVLRGRFGMVSGFLPLDVRAVTEIGENGRRELGLIDWWAFPEPLGKIVAYEVNDTFKQRRLNPDDVIAVYEHDRRGPLASMSALQVALNSIGLLRSMNRYTRVYLKNGGPSGLLKIKGRKLRDETEADMIRAKWSGEYSAGRQKEGQIAVIDDDADFQPYGADIQNVVNEALLFSEESGICSAFGVPPYLAGAYTGLRWNSQRAGAQSAQVDFWANKMSPTMAAFRVILTQRFLEKYEDSDRLDTFLRVAWDLSNVAALKEDEDKKAARIRADWSADLITRNEARIFRGWAPVRGGDVFRSGSAIELPEASGRRFVHFVFNRPGDRRRLPAAKAVVWEGLQLSRLPTAEEEKALHAVAAAQDAALNAIEPILEEARKALLNLAVRLAENLSSDYEGLTVDFPEGIRSRITSELIEAYQAGARTVAAELNLRSMKTEVGIVNRILSAITSALINQVVARFVSALLRRLLRDVPKEQALVEARAEIDQESLVYVKEIATGAAFQAIGDGRYDAISAAAMPGDRFIYSAVLDSNTCGVCKADDLKESLELDQLPLAPNPDCEGRWRCRCMIIIAHDNSEEN